MDIEFRPITKADPPSRRKKLAGGLLLLVAGLMPFSAGYLYYSTRNLTPVDAAASPEIATFHTERFSINYPGIYNIAYSVQRTMPDEKLSCLLGLKAHEPAKCTPSRPMIATSWILRSHKKIVASGASRGWDFYGSSRDDLMASIGSFQGKSGTDYELDVSIGNDMSALAAAHPRLIVEIHPSYTEGWAVPILLTLLIAIILAPVGLWKIGSTLIARAR